MDTLEQLIRDTLNDAAGSAPTTARHPTPGERPARRGAPLAIAAAAVSVAAIAVTVSILVHHDSSSEPGLGISQSVHRTPGAPAGEPMRISLGVYLSPDQRTLYAAVTERVAERGTTCWSVDDGNARMGSGGVASVRLTQHIIFRHPPVSHPGIGYACDDIAVGGPWYVRVPLGGRYPQAYVVDALTGKRHQILGTVDPPAAAIVNPR